MALHSLFGTFNLFIIRPFSPSINWQTTVGVGWETTIQSSIRERPLHPITQTSPRFVVDMNSWLFIALLVRFVIGNGKSPPYVYFYSPPASSLQPSYSQLQYPRAERERLRWHFIYRVNYICHCFITPSLCPSSFQFPLPGGQGELWLIFYDILPPHSLTRAGPNQVWMRDQQ